jgi:hypothetical protein
MRKKEGRLKLDIRNCNGTWIFDDVEKQVFDEPFVEGSSELITAMRDSLGLKGENLTLTFEPQQFQKTNFRLDWMDCRSNGTWNMYRCQSLAMEGWLCPVLLRYFAKPPRQMFVGIAITKVG